jgi:hypothetical protein
MALSLCCASFGCKLFYYRNRRRFMPNRIAVVLGFIGLLGAGHAPSAEPKQVKFAQLDDATAAAYRKLGAKLNGLHAPDGIMDSVSMSRDSSLPVIDSSRHICAHGGAA